MKLFVPGRVCLFGEHSDWAGGYRRTHPHIEKGYTLICGTNQGHYAEVEAKAEVLHFVDASGREKSIPMQPTALLDVAQRGGYWSYIAGTAYRVQQKYPVGGLHIHNYKTDLPMQKGLSSSAAICVLTARAFNHVYDLGLTVREEMELAYLGEITTPSQCGRMDQGCAFGSRPVLMTFDGDDLQVEEVEVNAPIYMVIVDLGAFKDTPKILADLHQCFPDTLGEIAVGVRELLGSFNKELVSQAVTAVRKGDSACLGQLMNKAQKHFDKWAMPACPEELTAPILHKVLAYPAIQPYILGGKGVGSQGDGSAQFVVRDPAGQAALHQILQETLGLHSLNLTLQPS